MECSSKTEKDLMDLMFMLGLIEAIDHSVRVFGRALDFELVERMGGQRGHGKSKSRKKV